jgi:hypothetical protein
MNQDLIVRDVRLQGPRPRGTEVLEVDADTPLAWPISWLCAKANAYSSAYVRLILMAHGYETQTAQGRAIFGTTIGAKYSQGGGGIQFCKEGISLDTVARFAPLRELLDWIDLKNCGTAYITPGFEGGKGDGNVLCSRLAQITQTPVRASTATQLYDATTTDFGVWEGTVLTYGPNGNVIRVEQDPAN